MSLRRSLILGCVLYTLVLIGLASLNRAILAAALPLVFYAGSALLFLPGHLRLTVSRTLSTTYTTPGKPVRVVVTVANNGQHMEVIRVADGVPPGLEIDGDTSLVAELPAGQTLELTYDVQGRRGSYRYGEVEVSAYDPSGLFRRRKAYDVPTRLSILPRVPEVRSVLIRPARTRGVAGLIPSRRGGSGTDFYGVRAYEPGDPLRWINWRMSARHPRELFTNEFEQERIADVGLILDARERSEVLLGGESLFEHSVEATAALADTFLEDGNRVALLIYGRGLERTFPGYGKHQRQRILRSLSQAQVGDSLVFDSFDYLPTRFFPAKSQIVLVSPLCEDDPPMLTRLRARGYEILVISPDAVDFEAKRLALPSRVAHLAPRIARAERYLWIRQLQRVGVTVIDWQVDARLDMTIDAAIRKPARQLAR